MGVLRENLNSSTNPTAAIANNAPAASTGEASVAAIRNHLLKDQNVVGKAFSEEQAAAITASMHAYTENLKKEWKRQMVLETKVDSSDEEEEEELAEAKDGEDGFSLSTTERRGQRRRARRGAENLMVDDQVERKPGVKRDAEELPPIEQPAVKSQDVARDIASPPEGESK